MRLLSRVPRHVSNTKCPHTSHSLCLILKTDSYLCPYFHLLWKSALPLKPPSAQPTFYLVLTPHTQALSLLCPQITSEVCPAGPRHPHLAPESTVRAFLPDCLLVPFLLLSLPFAPHSEVQRGTNSCHMSVPESPVTLRVKGQVCCCSLLFVFKPLYLTTSVSRALRRIS